MLKVMEQAADWADQKGVDYAFFRDGAEWTMQLKFSDAKGPFSEFYAIPESNTGRMEKQLDALCVKARKGRMKLAVFSKAA